MKFRASSLILLLMAAVTLHAGVVRAEDAAADDQASYEYDPTGKRDPFLPLFLLRRPAKQNMQPLTPLQRYEIGQLRLVGVVYNLAPPRAMVEDSSGLGFIVTPGTAIGPNGGVVTAIRPRQVVVEEWETDVIGQRHRKEIVLELPPDEVASTSP
ncbi:MAG TPA: pilus assembly protein PilP [Candidatus Binatia bacterium]